MAGLTSSNELLVLSLLSSGVEQVLIAVILRATFSVLMVLGVMSLAESVLYTLLLSVLGENSLVVVVLGALFLFVMVLVALSSVLVILSALSSVVIILFEVVLSSVSLGVVRSEIEFSELDKLEEAVSIVVVSSLGNTVPVTLHSRFFEI